MSVREIRRDKLRNLIDREGSQKSLADKVGLPPAYISQIMTRRRNLGDSVARQIEEKLGLKSGWLDLPYEEEGLSSDEREVLDMYRRMTNGKRRTWREVGASLAGLTDEHGHEGANSQEDNNKEAKAEES